MVTAMIAATIGRHTLRRSSASFQSLNVADLDHQLTLLRSLLIAVAIIFFSSLTTRHADDERFVLCHALVEFRIVRLSAAAVEGGGHGAAGAVGAVEK